MLNLQCQIQHCRRPNVNSFVDDDIASFDVLRDGLDDSELTYLVTYVVEDFRKLLLSGEFFIRNLLLESRRCSLVP
jgi:hypothetical protein